MFLGPVFDHQRLFRVVVIADDINHAIQMQEGDDKAFQDLKPVINLF